MDHNESQLEALNSAPKKRKENKEVCGIHNGQFACWTNFQVRQEEQNLLLQLKTAS